MPTYDVCRVDQLVEGRGRPARAGDHYVAVFLDRGRIYVVENVCKHAASPLDGGAVIGRGKVPGATESAPKVPGATESAPKVPGATESAPKVQCPWHGWVYDLRTGNHLTAFGERPGIATYPCHVEAGVVKVTVDDPAGEAQTEAGI